MFELRPDHQRQPPLACDGVLIDVHRIVAAGIRFLLPDLRCRLGAAAAAWYRARTSPAGCGCALAVGLSVRRCDGVVCSASTFATTTSSTRRQST